ncbi:MAG: phage protein NinX family protein [Pantoea agglomerans]
MNYSEMTDFEINCAVAASLGRELFYNSPGEPGKRRKSFVINDRCRDVYESDAWSSDVFAPCKSWADAGPIIERYRITIMPASQGENWMAQAFEYALADVSTRPLRSAMIVFLMMQEKANA